MAGIVFDITEKKRIETSLVDENKILSELSSIDGLTQVNNHRSLLNFLKEAMINSMKNDQQLTIGIFDVDDFKRVNDTKGHVFGDKVLFDLASIMKGAVRDNDLVGRYGGEEFMIVLPNTNIDQAKVVAERIRASIAKKMFGDLHITVSGGLKQYNNEELAEFVHQADLNLYQAKATGKNKVIS
jgi:diguanylate cyclase (GGDEF)-like protein